MNKELGILWNFTSRFPAKMEIHQFSNNFTSPQFHKSKIFLVLTLRFRVIGKN